MSLGLMFLLIQAAPATVAPANTPFTNLEDAKIVCRTLSGTGSRLNTQRVCLPKREWQRMWDDSKETMHGLQDRSSRQDPSSR